MNERGRELTSSDSEHFDTRGRVGFLWRTRANELHEATRVVWQGGRVEDGTAVGMQMLYRPAQLLMGLSLEVALKGLLVEREPTLISGGKIAGLKTHSLEELFRKANIPLEDGEEELNFVRKLSDAVEWVAKYPVPGAASQLRDPKHQSTNTLARNDGDFGRFEALWRMVNAEFLE